MNRRCISYDSWYESKRCQSLLDHQCHRERVLRSAVLTLFKQYQAKEAFNRWREKKEREEDTHRNQDIQNIFLSSSSPSYIEWMYNKQKEAEANHRRLQQLQQHQQQIETEQAQIQQNKNEQEYQAWKERKSLQRKRQLRREQLRHHLKEQRENKNKQNKLEKSHRSYQEWKKKKEREQHQIQEENKRIKEDEKKAKEEKKARFVSEFDHLCHQYLQTIRKWRLQEENARQKQDEKMLTVRQRNAKKHQQQSQVIAQVTEKEGEKRSQSRGGPTHAALNLPSNSAIPLNLVVSTSGSTQLQS